MSPAAGVQEGSLDLSFEALEGDYASKWRKMRLAPHFAAGAQNEAKRIAGNRVQYSIVQVQTKVPWYVTGLIHLREANLNFHAWLYNGDPMMDHRLHPVQTVHVPYHRPPNPAVSWSVGAVDALQEINVAQQDWEWTPERCAWVFERMNGFGYREWHHIPSPYLWGGTSVQEPGKYTRDKHFDPNVMDEQLGTMGILKFILDEEQKA